MARILALGGKPRLLKKAASLGIDVVQVVKPSQSGDAAPESCSQVHLVDYQDPGQALTLARRLHAEQPFDRVLTQTEAAQQIAAYLNEQLGLPGNSLACVRMLHDKYSLRRRLNSAGLGPVAVEVLRDEAGLSYFVKQHGAAVIKPRSGSGSLGVRFVEGADDVSAAWGWVTDFGLDSAMVEQRLKGEEISVETFAVDGTHHVVAVTGKTTDAGGVELGHVVPFPLADPEPVYELVAAMLEVVGLVEGPAHTEVILTPDGPRIIESHARRGGDRINELVQIACGVDLEELTFRLALEGAPVVDPRPVGAAAIRYLTAEPGVVDSVTGVEACESLAGVEDFSLDVEVGDLVHPLRWSEDRCGWVMARGLSPAEASAIARRAAAGIAITTSPVAEQGEPATLQTLLADVDEVLDPFARLISDTDG